MSATKVQILNQSESAARLKRIAYEIYERNYLEDEIIIIGIDERGSYLAGEIAQYISAISPLNVHLADANVDRSDDSIVIGIDLSIGIDELKDQVVIVVNDVLHTGITLLHVVAILLHAGPKIIQTAVLINRGHRVMPIDSDYVGMELATTIHQHIQVIVDEAEKGAEAFLV
ncbi:MAG: phosphoribosyltransferase family protein [Bacteroidota bacterium]